MPGAGRRAGIDRQRERMPAEPLIGNLRALELDAVRPLDDERQWCIQRGRALRVAQQRGEIGRFAGTIDTALGIDEGVKPGRRGPARDAAIGQIEGRRLQIEKGVIAFRIGGGEQCGSGTALSWRSAAGARSIALVLRMDRDRRPPCSRALPCRLGLLDFPVSPCGR